MKTFLGQTRNPKKSRESIFLLKRDRGSPRPQCLVLHPLCPHSTPSVHFLPNFFSRQPTPPCRPASPAAADRHLHRRRGEIPARNVIG